jgi:uncharacterized protein YdcH (DUF465 family)
MKIEEKIMKPPLLPHALHQEFPEFAEKIQALKQSDVQFARLLSKHDAVDTQITKVEEKLLTITDEALHHLKQERLLLKDQLYQQLVR